MNHRGFGHCCLCVVVLVAACGSAAASTTEIMPTQAVEEMLLHQVAGRICPYPDKPDELDPYERYFDAEALSSTLA
jgi:hypothetical protein